MLHFPWLSYKCNNRVTTATRIIVRYIRHTKFIHRFLLRSPVIILISRNGEMPPHEGLEQRWCLIVAHIWTRKKLLALLFPRSMMNIHRVCSLLWYAWHRRALHRNLLVFVRTYIRGDNRRELCGFLLTRVPQQCRLFSMDYRCTIRARESVGFLGRGKTGYYDMLLQTRHTVIIEKG